MENLVKSCRVKAPAGVEPAYNGFANRRKPCNCRKSNGIGTYYYQILDVTGLRPYKNRRNLCAFAAAMLLVFVCGCTRFEPESSPEVGSRSLSGARRALVLSLCDQAVQPNPSHDAAADWGFVEYDTGGFVDPMQPTRFTIPAGVTCVTIGASVVWECNPNGMRQFVIKKNGQFMRGGVVFNSPANSRTTADFSGWSAPLMVQEGDYFEVFVYHNLSTPVNLLCSTGTWFSIVEH